MSLIYCLYSTCDGYPRYVGQTTKPIAIRLAQHVRDARRGSGTQVGNWIRAILAAGFEVRAHVLQTAVAPGDLNLFERYWISQFAGLLNSDPACPRATDHSAVAMAVLDALQSGLPVIP